MNIMVKTHKATSVMLKKLKRAILYSVNGKEWFSLYDGTEQEIANTWMMMQAGFCNDDLVESIHKYNQNKGEV